MNRNLAKTSLGIKGDSLGPLNQKFRGLRVGWFQVRIKWCCQEPASLGSAVALCWLPSQTASPFVRARWLPAAPRPHSVSREPLSESHWFWLARTGPHILNQSLRLLLAGSVLLVEGEVGVDLSEPHGPRVGEGGGPTGKYYQMRGIICRLTKSNSVTNHS